MSLLHEFERSRRRRQMQNYFWPWSLFVIAVGIVFFQLGKVSKNYPARVSSSARYASPVFQIPSDRGRTIKKGMKSRAAIEKRRSPKAKTFVAKKYSKRRTEAKKPPSGQVTRRERTRTHAIGAGPKLVRE